MKNSIFIRLFIILLCFVNSTLDAQTFSVDDVFPGRRKIDTENKLELENLTLYYNSAKTGDNEYLISGRIVDSDTNESIPGITIKEEGSETGSISDIDGKFQITSTRKNPKLEISMIGFDVMTADTAEGEKSDKDEDEDKNALTSLAGLFVANLGEDAIVQPNIVLSQSWKIGRSGVELRILGLQNNKDTLVKVNGLNLVKPEISKLNFRLTGDIKFLKNNDRLTFQPQVNIFTQRINKMDELAEETSSDDITSVLMKVTGGYMADEGLHFYLSGVYYNVFSGVEYFKKRFGDEAKQSFFNVELTGKFQIQEGALKNTFVEASYIFNSSNFKSLLDTEDSGVFLLRIGFNKALKK